MHIIVSSKKSIFSVEESSTCGNILTNLLAIRRIRDSLKIRRDKLLQTYIRGLRNYG